MQKDSEPLNDPHLKATATPLHPAEAGPAAAAAAQADQATPLAAILSAHLLRDGEVVLLAIKPSVWFIFLSSASFNGAVLLASLALAVIEHHRHDRLYLETAVFFIGGRLMWAVLQWMGRLYVLTDMRVLRLAGVFSIDVFDCPLRKIVRTRLVSRFREKLVLTGSIEIIPKDETVPSDIWQTIAKPKLIHQRLVAAINRARQSGTGLE
jgi:hypothetical protein